MLHELLLSLSGTKSADSVSAQTFPLLSPSEKALVSSLSHLSKLHWQSLERASTISSSHPSTVCRAVSAAVVSTHLAKFQRKILEVEKGIVHNDASYVGGYGLVPLSAIVAEFESWTRRLEWLWETVKFIQPMEEDDVDQRKRTSPRRKATGASIINRLRDEMQTGYPDLEEVITELVTVAETAWLRQLSTWVLYGRRPSFGAEDFFIQPISDNDTSRQTDSDFVLDPRLLPAFVTTAVASSILFIGRSLTQIRTRGSSISLPVSSSTSSPELALLPTHLKFLSTLKPPISPSSLGAAISAIRRSLSQTALRQLLPLSKIVETMSILRAFLLLDNGEFAVALISEADQRLRSRGYDPKFLGGDKSSESLKGLIIKEGEVSAVLAKTWAALSTYQSEEDGVDEKLDLARDLLFLSPTKAALPSVARNQVDQSLKSGLKMADVQFNDLLLSTPATLSLRITPPLDLFLTNQDLEAYSAIHSYLLSIRRAHIHLTNLWKQTTIRREHPSPLGPPKSNTKIGEQSLLRRRQRSNIRARKMREVWATSGSASFLLAELGNYFQGEVIKGNWEEFRAWLELGNAEEGRRLPADSETNDDIWNPSSSLSSQRTGNRPSRPQTAQSSATFDHNAPHDPETLSQAHHSYLSNLLSSLFLTDHPFVTLLRGFLVKIDHLVSCVNRIERCWVNVDLEEDEGVFDGLKDFAAEETEVLVELSGVIKNVKEAIDDLFHRLESLDEESGKRGVTKLIGEHLTGDHYEPSVAIGGVDRLLMKLDFGNRRPHGNDESKDHDLDNDDLYE
jgi:Gamma tubulin complex component N-terminal/Gamma tubulin complex component C-terminal